MSTKLDDDTLRDPLLEQMSQSKEFQSEVKAYELEYDTKTYELLMRCIERFLSKRMAKRHRQQHIASSAKPDAGIATPAVKGKWRGTRGGEEPAGYGARWGAVGQPCFAYQTNSCKFGDGCRYQHSKISQEEYQKLKNKKSARRCWRTERPRGSHQVKALARGPILPR